MNKFKGSTQKFLVFVFLAIAITGMVSCGKNKDSKNYKINKNLDTSNDITLRIASGQENWLEMDAVIAKFEDIYPNCTVLTEYVEDYQKNLASRLLNEETKVDIFRTTNIFEDTPWRSSALNLISEDSKKILDLSNCHQGLVNNFKYAALENTQYAIPFGGEMRGMFVNLTLLKSLDLDVPNNKSEFLDCCAKLLEAGFVPIQSHYGTLGQQMMYPAICNRIVNGGNYEEVYNDVQNIAPGISEYFREEFSFFYDLVKEGYIDCKKVSSELGYSFAGSTGKALDFFNVVSVSSDTYEKKDDIGKIPFLIDTQALASYLDTAKTDYHSAIEYQFVATPVSEKGGYAYLSPADALAINNNSNHLDWSLEFLNFFFTPDIATEFAELSQKIPNTKDALIKYDLDEDQTCDVGQVTFNYGSGSFYRVITTLLLSGYSESYIETNENYRDVYPNETYYRLVKGDYTLADSAYIQANPSAKIYRYSDSNYVIVDAAYITENPTENFYYKEADSYVAVDSNYILENPSEKYYRYQSKMPGIPRITEEKYMTLDSEGKYTIAYSLDDFLTRLESEFQKVKAARDGKTS